MTSRILEVLLLSRISSNKETIAVITAEIGKLQDRINKLLNENADCLKEHQSICTHTNTTTEHSYSEGGYDYKSVTTYTYKCVRCNKILGTKEEIGSYA